MAEHWVEVGARRLRVRSAGEGPVVVLDTGGGAGGIGSWPGVEDELVATATVLTYDRAGLGASDPPAARPTAQDMADDLVAVLDACAAGQPIVLVGFSLGGLVAQLVACQQPQRVSGLVLVDPTAPEAFDEQSVLARALDPTAVLTGAFWLLTRLGRGRGLVRRYVTSQLGEGAQPDVVARMVTELGSPRFWSGVRLETARLRESCAQTAAAVAQQGLPDVPLVVLTAGRRSGKGLLARTSHQRIAATVPQGRLEVVDGAPHNVVALRPDAIVAAVRVVLGSVLGEDPERVGDQPHHLA